MSPLWKKQVTLSAFLKHNSLPETPGVYFFLDAEENLLYIGKATALRDRVKSYFVTDIAKTRGPKIQLMLAQVMAIAYVETDSVLEALILESNLIKAKQPPYNTDAKDNKSYQHVVITKEPFPRVLIVRGRDIEQKKFTAPIKYLFGPYPAGGALREALRIIRQLFPYRDRCTPWDIQPSTNNKQQGAKSNQSITPKQHQEKTRAPKPCFNAQLGLCPGVCSGALSARAYGKTINHIRLFFEGHKNAIVRQLTREMRQEAKALRFEQAGAIKKTLFALQHIQDMALIKDDLREKHAHRIEAYDVAHLGGTASVGVMVVVEESRPNKSAYRQFRLREKHGGNDLSALAETLKRRLRHGDWPLPELIVVDGAFLQLDRAKLVLQEAKLTIPIVGVVKDARHQPKRLLGPKALTERFDKEMLLANSEAHRFALAFHRVRRGKEFLKPEKLYT